MRVHPNQPEGLSFPPHEIRRRGDRPRRQGMITAEHERSAPLFEHPERGLVQPLADPRDVADVFLRRISFSLNLWNRRDEIAGVDDGDPEAGEPFGEAGDPESRRPHVDATPIAAQIERDADDMDGARHIAKDTVFDVTPKRLVL